MNAKTWLQTKKTPITGGLIGVIACLTLFLFYSFLYFPIIKNRYNATTPVWVLIPPIITGHAFPFIAGFVVEDSPIINTFCKPTIPVCTTWNGGNFPDCKIPVTMEGTPGCCVEQIMTPATTCADKAATIGMVLLTLPLFVIYFVIGALVASRIQKKKLVKP